MVLMFVTCSQCRNTGTFDFELKFRPAEKHCKTCHRDESDYWSFNFCTLSCFMTWLKENDVAAAGIPCQNCLDHDTGKPCGFMGGFRQNPKCTTCNGTGRCRGRLVAPAGYQP